MGIELAAIHGIYVPFVALIIGFLICRRDTTLICIVGICALGWMAGGSLITAVSGIFSSFVYAIKELLGTILIISIRVGLPALAVAMSMNLFGHGIALSGDFIIQGAPKLTADAANLPVASVIAASVPLVLVMGIVTTCSAFWFIRRDMKSGKLTLTSGQASPIVASSPTLLIARTFITSYS